MKNAPANVLAAYLDQDFVYWSESDGTYLAIHEMDPTHAGNAANKILRDSDEWARARYGRPVRWAISDMVNTNLVTGLLNRAAQAS